MTPEQLVRDLYERYQARDWPAAAELLHHDAELEMPATAEHLTGRDQVIALQRNYPEPWGDLGVLRVLGAGDSAVAELQVIASDAEFRCAAFGSGGMDCSTAGLSTGSPSVAKSLRLTAPSSFASRYRIWHPLPNIRERMRDSAADVGRTPGPR